MNYQRVMSPLALFSLFLYESKTSRLFQGAFPKIRLIHINYLPNACQTLQVVCKFGCSNYQQGARPNLNNVSGKISLTLTGIIID